MFVSPKLTFDFHLQLLDAWMKTSYSQLVDSNQSLKIINKYEPLRHDEYKEREDDIDGLNVELCDINDSGYQG